MNIAKLCLALTASVSLGLTGVAKAADTVTADGPLFGDKLVDLKVFVLDAGVKIVRANLASGWFKDGSSELIAAPEFAVGLGHGVEFSILSEYFVSAADTEGAESGVILPELRYAPASWGKLRWNPTVALGYEFVPEDADIYKVSLYLSDNLNERWFWASNFTYQKRNGGDKELELIGKFGLHHTLRSNRLSLGAELKVEHAKVYGVVAGTAQELLLGPALIWRPTSKAILRVGSAFGVGGDSPNNESTVSFEWSF
jgi:hypothetical protein